MIPKWAESALDKPAKYSAEEIAAARETLKTTSPLEEGTIFTIGAEKALLTVKDGVVCKYDSRATITHKKRGRPRKG